MQENLLHIHLFEHLPELHFHCEETSQYILCLKVNNYILN